MSDGQDILRSALDADSLRWIKSRRSRISSSKI